MSNVYLNCFHKGRDELDRIRNSCGFEVKGVANSTLDRSLIFVNDIDCWSWERDILVFKEESALANAVGKYESLCEGLKIPDIGAETYAHCRLQLMRQVYSDHYSCFMDTLIRYFVLRTTLMISDRQITHMLSLVVPHHFGDYLIARVASAIGVKSIFIEEDIYLCDNRAGYFLRDIECGDYLHSDEDNRHLQFVSSQGAVVDKSLASYKPAIQEYVCQARRESVSQIKQSLQGTAATIALRQLSHLVSLKKFVKTNGYRGDSENGYFLVCLHVEPEATVSPLSFKWLSQLSFILRIARVLERLDLDIVVREHPHQLSHKWGDFNANAHLYKSSRSSPRALGFYRELMSLVNMKGFDLDRDVSDSLQEEKCKGCVSLNGTVLIESLRKQKPVICSSTWIGSQCHLAVSASREESLGALQGKLEAVLKKDLVSERQSNLLDQMRAYRFRCDIEGLESMQFGHGVSRVIGML